MSSKRKLLRKIMAGIMKAPEGWEQLVESATNNVVPVRAATAAATQENASETVEITATVDTIVADAAPTETTEVPTTRTHRVAQDLTAQPPRKNAPKPPTGRPRTATKRNISSKAKKE